MAFEWRCASRKSPRVLSQASFSWPPHAKRKAEKDGWKRVEPAKGKRSKSGPKGNWRTASGLSGHSGSRSLRDRLLLGPSVTPVPCNGLCRHTSLYRSYYLSSSPAVPPVIRTAVTTYCRPLFPTFWCHWMMTIPELIRSKSSGGISIVSPLALKTFIEWAFSRPRKHEKFTGVSLFFWQYLDCVCGS